MKVSVIVPTRNRPELLKRCIAQFNLQDWPNKEIIINNSQGTIGAKRNDLCAAATGDIIVHMDDDDLYTTEWISRSVRALTESKADVVGLSNAWFYDMRGQLYEYKYDGRQPYVCGATMCYWRKVWARNPFQNISNGEDAQFLGGAGRIIPHSYKDGFIAMLHGNNTCSHLAVQYGVKQMKPANCQLPALLKAHLPIGR